METPSKYLDLGMRFFSGFWLQAEMVNGMQHVLRASSHVVNAWLCRADMGKNSAPVASSCGSSPHTNHSQLKCLSDSVHVAVDVILRFLMLIGRRRETTQPNPCKE